MAQVDSEIQMILEKQRQRNAAPSSGDPEIDAILSAQRAAASKKGPEEPEILNEAAGLAGRTRVKMFGSSDPVEQADYLRSLPENKDFEISDSGGEVIARKKGEKAWKKLDPTGVTGPKEALEDVLDIGYEAVSGPLTAAAGAAGAIPGGILGFGAGGIGTAALASGAASAGLEAIRQGIGKYVVGSKKEVSPLDVGVSGLLGGATTGILGSGLGKKALDKAIENPQVVNKAISWVSKNIPVDLEEPVKKEIARAALTDAQKGLISRKLGLSAASKMVDIDKNVLEKAPQQLPQKLVDYFADRGVLQKGRDYTYLELNDALEEGGMSVVATSSIKNVSDAVNNWKSDLQDEIGRGIRLSTKKVDSNKYLKPLEDFIEEKERKFAETGRGLYKKEADEARAALDVFSKKPEAGGVPFFDLETGMIVPERRALLRSGKSSEVSIGDLYDLKNALTDEIAYSKNGQFTVRNQPITSTKVKGLLEKANKAMGDDIDDAFAALEKEGLKGVRQKYGELIRVQNILAPRFRTEEAALRTVENYDAQKNRIVRDAINRIPEEYTNGMNLSDLVDVAAINKAFGGKQQSLLRAGIGAGAGSQLGYWLGLMSGVPGLANLGGAAGFAIGGLATSPSAVKGALRAQSAISKGLGGAAEAAGKVAAPVSQSVQARQIRDVLSRMSEQVPAQLEPTLTTPGMAQTAWQLMKGNQR
jgi:hypothetical protein